MSKNVICCFCLSVFFTLLPAAAYSGYISMVIQTTITANPEKVEVKITVQNNGDEPAYTVYPELRLGAAEIKLPSKKKIGITDTHQWTHTFSSIQTGLTLYGTYPLLITLHYHDSNMFPSSMPEVVLFNLVKPGRKLPFSGTLETTEVADSGQVSLALNNGMSQKLAGNVRLFLPKELTTVNNPSPFELQAKQTGQVLFPITNRGAMSGSRYRIFAVMEYDLFGMHYTELASGTIAVVDLGDNSSGRARIVGSGIFIFLLFLLTVFLELRRREN